MGAAASGGAAGAEAGGRDWNPLIHVPAGFFKMLDHPTLTWKYRAEADLGTNGRAIIYTRGRVIGGSSSINGLIYIRGQPEDYDHWAQHGNRGWSWDDCLPFFRKAERWEGEGSAVRGKDGPLFTSKMDRSPVCATVIEAGKQLGLEYREDVNDLPPGWAITAGLLSALMWDFLFIPPLFTFAIAKFEDARVHFQHLSCIEAVEVRVDNGPWHEATLAAVPDLDTWRQWVWEWDATDAGTHTIEARATDKTGYTQTAVQTPEAPNGASGYPLVQVSVS